MHISFVPIVDKKLRSNVYFDGPAKISRFRQEVYEINKKYGFKKKTTQKRSKKLKLFAKHYQEVREYEALDKLIKNLNNSKSCLKFHLIPKIDPRKNTNLSQFNEICKGLKG